MLTCHVLQTFVKHRTGLPDKLTYKLYKKDPFKEGNKYFKERHRRVSTFTTPPMETKKLKGIESQKEQRLLEVEEKRTKCEKA